ncbi:MAG TPA: 2-oxoacid:acceptor oxidoreductase subunit alpha, partial [Deferrisomatales bacterium]|nr:2-oxoacid:acceptor oxidoreductase subunit alpha [Deferrisomatales bacterium]
PSTEIAEGLAARLPAVGGTFIQMEDEIASIAACLGASLTGAKAMTATSGPGFSLMQELIGYGCIAEIPLVIVNVMRYGPSTGLPTNPSQGDVMQARWGTHGDHPIVVYTASSVEEAFAMTVRAFNTAEKYRNPVILLLDEGVGHMREKIRLPTAGGVERIERIHPSMPPEWYAPYEETNTGVPPMAPFGDGYRFHVTGLVHDRMGFPTQKHSEIASGMERIYRKITRGFREICRTESVWLEDAKVAVLAYGSVARSAREAVEELRTEGKPVGLLSLQTLWPFPRAALERVVAQVDTLLVCELNRGQIYREAWRVSRGRCDVQKLVRDDGTLIAPTDIAKRLREWL